MLKLKHLAILPIAAVMLGCGYSPLLNHHEAPLLGESEAPASELFELQPFTPAFDLSVVQLRVGLKWIQKQTEDQAGKFQILFWRETGNTATPFEFVSPAQEVFVKLWMPDHGHGSSPVKVAPALDADGKVVSGLYDCANVFFSMPGKWEIRVILRVPGTGGSFTIVDKVYLPHMQ